MAQWGGSGGDVEAVVAGFFSGRMTASFAELHFCLDLSHGVKGLNT